jgi:hypothetical protein
MKIAVCISGGVRYPHLGLQSIQKIIPNEYVKVFIHTWKIKDRDAFLKSLHGLEHKEVDKTVETNLSSLEDYNYEKLLIENYEECEKKFRKLLSNLKFVPSTDPEDEYPRNYIGPISMHYSIHKTNELKKDFEKENNITFDWVIRMRTDSDFKSNVLDVRSLSGELNIPSGEDWSDSGINDQFAIGKSNAMDLYSNLYNNFHHNQSVKYYPERILYSHLKNMNLNIGRIDFPVRINNGQDFRKTWYPDLVSW